MTREMIKVYAIQPKTSKKRQMSLIVIGFESYLDEEIGFVPSARTVACFERLAGSLYNQCNI